MKDSTYLKIFIAVFIIVAWLCNLWAFDIIMVEEINYFHQKAAIHTGLTIFAAFVSFILSILIGAIFD